MQKERIMYNMYYLVCYKLEKAVAVEDDVDLTNLNNNCPAHLKRFFKEVGENPVTKIDQNYPSFSAIMDNYQIFGETTEYLH